MDSREVIQALERYLKDKNEDDRKTAARIGVPSHTLRSWISGAEQPQRQVVVRIAGVLKCAGYI
ncbi:MAG: hypothetical protein JO076_09735 [Verrucomicrobia bacterium]|nr:hypothetical protein [Verrucomicrobiota bacterium]